MRSDPEAGGAATMIGLPEDDQARVDGGVRLDSEPEGAAQPVTDRARVEIARLELAPSPPPARREPIELDFREAGGFAYAGETLSVLGSLEIGRPVLHRNGYIPWDMLALASARGIRYTIQSGRPGDVRILMWRHTQTKRQRHWPELRERYGPR